jgi:FimV-like protein
MKLIKWMNTKWLVLVGMALLIASPAFGLGLGSAEVRSYLNQPLLARIALISQTDEELGTITARLASAADVEMMGLSRSVSVPLHFEVLTEAGDAYVEVSSRLSITEPVIQFVLEVQWAGGRMLREYTLFLDPPTFASKAPLPVVSSRPAAVAAQSNDTEPLAVRESDPVQSQVAENYPDPSRINVVETIKPEPVADPVGPEPVVTDVPAPEVPPEIIESAPAEQIVENLDPEPTVEEARQTVTVPAEPEIPEPQVVESIIEEEAPAVIEPEPVSPEPEPVVTEPELVVEEPAAVTSEQEQETEPEALVQKQEPTNLEPGNQESDNQEPETIVEPPEELIAEELVAEELVAEELVAEELVAEELVAEELVAEELVAEEIIAGSEEAESTDDIHGPVQKGETLWGIASNYTSGSNYSINQAMLAIQRLNPDAFGGQNINSLKQGSILRMPTFTEIGRMSKRQAMVEAIRQEQLYAARRSGEGVEDLPAISDLSTQGIAGNDSEAAASPATGTQDAGRLQLVPPSSQPESSAGGVGSGDAAVGAVSNQEVEEVLARTEEELANAQQENAYLNERIRELEEQVSAQRTAGGIEDNALADIENNLRDQRLSEEPLSSESESDEPWYVTNSWYVIGGLLLLIALVVWILRKMGTGSGSDPDGSKPTVEAIRTEAEDILKSLDEPETSDSGSADDETETGNVIELESYADSEGESEKPVTPTADGKKAKVIPMNEEEAVELDSDDPEVQLDLARAYISMGDIEAARDLLTAVLENGNEDQVNEATQMMKEL